MKNQIDRSPEFDRFECLCNVGQDAALGWNFEALAQFVEHVQNGDDAREVVTDRVDPDHSVAAAVHQSIEYRSHNAA